MCDKFYKQCKGCGEQVHMNTTCQKGCGDPWGLRSQWSKDLEKLRILYMEVNQAIKDFHD